MPDAVIEEIFASIQGEGPWIGQRQLFVRFSGCNIACKYCDTQTAVQSTCRAQLGPDSFAYEQIGRNVSAPKLSALCARLRLPGTARQVLSLTGGEPLLHEDFLAEWLPTIKNDYLVYLETNGVRHSSMSRLARLVDVVSMDFKLPSATGLRPFWDEHKRFLLAAQTIRLFVKVVITADTIEQDVLQSADLISEHHADVPLILQPASGRLAPDAKLLIKMQNAALAVIRDVRIIPQAHKMLQVP